MDTKMKMKFFHISYGQRFKEGNIFGNTAGPF